jgi:hypothetical protein
MTRSRSIPPSTRTDPDAGAAASVPVPVPTLAPAPALASTTLASTTLALVVVLGAVAAAASGAAVARSDRPTIEVVGGPVAGGDATTLRVVLTSAPEGLAGYYLRLSVADAGVARFANASYPERFGLTSEPELGEDGRTVALEAADMDDAVEPGARNVTLATVTVSGVSPGEARVTVEPIQLDADGGSTIDATTRAAEITVTPEGGSDADGDAGTEAGSAAGDATAEDAAAAAGAGANADESEPDRAGSGAGAGAGVPSVLLVAGAAALLAVGLLIGRRL